jgi:glycosyltransferase involved in cell wall biosynthesis
VDKKKLRIAVIGIRNMPPSSGSAGEDKIASELYPRLVERGAEMTAYLRVYQKSFPKLREYKGVKLVYLWTTSRSGFDTLLHSMKATFHVIFFNTADVVHIHNGGNSIWAIFLRLAGKRVFVSQDGVDWQRAKWPWYARLYLYFSSIVTAYASNGVIIDNIFFKNIFEKRFRKTFSFIPYGSEVPEVDNDNAIFRRLGVKPEDYFLFVGRFIPDKGLHYLISAFERVKTDKKLLLVGGSPNPSSYEKDIQKTTDSRILFPGYVYGDDVVRLMKNAYTYIQPSDVEGLSPVVLMVMGLGTPLICSDIQENRFVVQSHAGTFVRGDVGSLSEQLNAALQNPAFIKERAETGKDMIYQRFNWERVADEHILLFSGRRRHVGQGAMLSDKTV